MIGGESIPLLSTIRELHIDDHLGFLNERDKKMVLALSINRVVRPTAMHNIKTWYENSFLSKEFSLPLTSQQISNFLGRIGDSDIPHISIEKMIISVGAKSTFIHDITVYPATQS